MEIDKELLLKEKEEIEATLHDLRETGHHPSDSAVIYYEGKYAELVRLLYLTKNKNAPGDEAPKGKITL